MSLLTLAALVVLSPPQATVPAVSAVVQDTQMVAVDAPAQIRELRAAVSTALKETVVKPAFDSESAVPRLAKVYAALRQDRHLAVTERDRLMARVRSRLRQIEQHLVREERRTHAASVTAAAERPAKISVPAAQAVLAQQPGQIAGAGFAGMQGFQGGGGLGAGSGSQAGGLSLVELIQTTIAPETWDVNGGKGTIRFFGPLDVLVVSQP